MCRKISGSPIVKNFIPSNELPENSSPTLVTLEEFEAIRLGDWFGLYHDECARQMGISRQTFGNIITTARQKIAGSIVNGQPITIEPPEVGCRRDNNVCNNCSKSVETCCKKAVETDIQTCCGKRQKRCCKKMVENKKGDIL